MTNHVVRSRMLAGFLAATLAAWTGAAVADTPQEKLYQGYYLDQAKGDCESAAALYEEVANDRQASEAVRNDARARLAACREEVASNDFATLMPETALAYIEIKRPGDQLLKLLEQLGLLANENKPTETGGHRVAISPAMIKDLIGVKGAALAVTGFDPVRQKPAGVLVFHPGNLEFVRGLIETGLPIGAKPAEAVRGYATYHVENEIFVTLTSRLVIASPQRTQIEAVLRRLNGEETSSLATAESLKQVMKDRGDSLLYFCINAKPLMPLIDGLMAMGGQANREVAMARALLDPSSLRALVGRAGVSDDGLSAEFTLSLDEGHHNLVYNLLRMPPINWDTLKSIPAGAAGFVVGALNEAPSRHAANAKAPANPPFVSFMDIGREIFGNITSFALFALPPRGAENASGLPIPDAAIVFTVIDPSKSEALWQQALGIASMASGSGAALEGQSYSAGGATVHTFELPEHFTVHCAVSDNDVILASSRPAIEAALAAKRDGKSVLDDPAFAAILKRLEPDTTKAVVVHAGRALQIAEQFAPAGDVEEMKPFQEILADTVASIVVDQSPDRLHWSAKLRGVPNVAGFVDTMIARKEHEETVHHEMRQAMQAENWDQALGVLDTLLADHPQSRKLLRKKFDILAVHKGDHEGAEKAAQELIAVMGDNAMLLNNFAWALLTEAEYHGDFTDLALKVSEKSNRLSDYKDWRFVDTLALGKFQTENFEEAISLEEKAIQLAPEGQTAELEKALARFKGSKNAGKVADGNEIK